jgi:hypothetical protein
MRQTSYDTIVACIQHGAAATANQLIEELNGVINDSNTLRQLAQQAAEKAEAIKAEQPQEPAEKEENTEIGE